MHFGNSTQHYFLAELIGGEFGSGDGPEMESPAESESGSYRAVWMPMPRRSQYRIEAEADRGRAGGGAGPEWLLDGWLETPAAFDEV